MRLIRLSAYLLASLSCLSVSEASQNKVQRFFQNSGGINNRTSTLVIPEQFAYDMENLSLDTRGQLTTRGAFRINNTTGTLGPIDSVVYGGGFHSAASGTSFFGVVIGSDVYRTGYSLPGSYTKVTSSVVVTESASNIFQTASINDSLVFCSELDAPFRITSSTTAIVLGGGAPDKAKSCATYGNYLILGNTTESSTAYSSRIRWSDINNERSWPANNYIDVEPNDGDFIVAVVAYGDRVYVFKRRAIYEVLITGDSGANAFIIRPIARGVGAWAKGSVKAVGSTGIFFLGQNGVYQFDGQSLDLISDNIQGSIDDVIRTNYANSVAAVYPKRNQYWLAVSTAGTVNTQILVYDYVIKSWVKYTGVQAAALISGETSTGDNVLLVGDYASNVYKADQDATADTSDDVTNAITVSYTTPWLTMGGPEITKEYKYLYIYTQINTSTATLYVDYSYDYIDTVENTDTVDLGQAASVYDTAIYDTDIFATGYYKVSRIEINRSSRALKLGLRVSSSSARADFVGWAIVYRPEDWTQ